MYCSTCGAHVPAGRSHCTTCGSWTASPAQSAGGGPAPLARTAHAPLPNIPPAAAHTCHRCGYNGEGVTYFSKGSHIAGLIVLGLVSAGFMGVFALIYYLSFRDHQICPRCGKDWGSQKDLLLAPGRGAGGALQPAVAAPRSSSANGWSIALLVVAALLLVAGIGSLELAPVLLGATAGAGGLALQNVARKEREARRAALLANLQLPVLKLASQRQGRLTVTETAAALGWPLPRAEKVLNSLEDGLRVNSEVTDEGVIVYEFRELAGPRRGELPPTA
jgi:hypothetical protein